MRHMKILLAVFAASILLTSCASTLIGATSGAYGKAQRTAGSSSSAQSNDF